MRECKGTSSHRIRPNFFLDIFSAVQIINHKQLNFSSLSAKKNLRKFPSQTLTTFCLALK